MNRIYDVRCLGEAFPLNVEDRLYFTWRLRACAQQRAVTLKISDGSGACIYQRRFAQAEQYLEPKDCPAFCPEQTYTYTLCVETDAYTQESEPARFVCGLTQGFDPSAKWISSGDHFIAETDTVGSPALYFRRRFSAKGGERAVLHICAAGLFTLKLNGQDVSDRVLEPAFTQYDKRALYSSFDVSGRLYAGENVLEVVLGDGWYNQTTKDTWGFYRAAWRDVPKFILQMRLPEGLLVSDERWEIGAGALVANAIRAGERWDARRRTEYRGPARVVAPPGGRLVPQQMPPIRETECFAPVSAEQTSAGMLYDFGQNMSGYCSARLCGKEGDTVRFIYSDRVRDGACDNASNSMYIFNPGVRYQTDEVTLGAEPFWYHPRFVYHGFRYVQVIGAVQISSMTAHFVHTDLERIGAWTCSDPLLERLYAMSINAILSNYCGFPTDCPHREKNGWTGDAQLTLETCLLNFDMQSAYQKWLNDFQDNMRPSGQISAIIPSCGWGYNWGSGPAWDVAMFRLTKALYDFYEDERTAECMYPYLQRYAAYMQGYENSEGLYCYGLGDWNYPQKISFRVCPTELTDSCYCLEMYQTLAALSDRFQPARADGYREQAAKLRKNIANKYAGEESLTGMCALTAFGICDRTEEILQYLKSNDYAPHCGILGGKFLFSVLCEKRQAETAYRVLTRTEYPSYGYWAACGQTALCEDFELTNSLNHAMYGFITEYMMKAFGGIRFRKGMREVEICPDLPAELERCACSVKTRYGLLRVESRRGPDKRRQFLVTVPPNTIAEFCAAGQRKRLLCGEYRLEEDA